MSTERADHHLPGRAEPKLLVSVRNVGEARAALSGGCDILDIKEPTRGSLGMADTPTIAAVLSAVSALSNNQSPVPVSAALGEVHHWTADQRLPRVPTGLRFVKLGPADLNASDWTEHWRAVRARFDALWKGRRAPHWIAVIYADWKSARAPRPAQIIEAAGRFECAGVLFDTHGKGRGTLLDFVPPDELADLVGRIQTAGMLAAVAGRIRIESLPALVAARPDVLAIRTAGCRDDNRNGPLCENRIREFKSALRASFAETAAYADDWRTSTPRESSPAD